MNNNSSNNNYLRFLNYVNNLETSENIKKYNISVKCRPTRSLFTDDVLWDTLYFDTSNPYNSIVSSGNISSFKTFSMCEMQYFTDVDKTSLLSVAVIDNITK